EALLEATLDEKEGADLLMVKPATLYLDVIAAIRERSNLPIGAYHVSGEYAMVMQAAAAGMLDADKALEEIYLGIKRAGADFIFSYAYQFIRSI
ncbi:MAG: porphobilinogen synthase, partial [Simkaniaceae bacterium]|nr:porphobilinogen synthase [Simkaniaceae bacterium]